MKNLGYVVLCFFGDGATNEGAFHEALNLAVVWNLPIVFFCENNLYAMSSSIKEMAKVDNISTRAIAYGFEGITINGNNVLEIIDTTTKAVIKAKNGEGPTLIEAQTYRWRGHSKSDARKYRTREEEKTWRKECDPIALFVEQLIAENLLTDIELKILEEKLEDELKQAIQFAEESPEPGIETLTTDIFA